MLSATLNSDKNLKLYDQTKSSFRCFGQDIKWKMFERHYDGRSKTTGHLGNYCKVAKIAVCFGSRHREDVHTNTHCKKLLLISAYTLERKSIPSNKRV